MPNLWLWITCFSVGLRQVRNHDLCVSLGSESSALKQRLSKKDTFAVDIQTGVNVVQSVTDSVQAAPECVVKNILRLSADLGGVGFDFHSRIHGNGSFGRRFALAVLHVPGAIQELAIQIGDLNNVVVRHQNGAFRTRAHAHASPVFQHFAANGAGTHQKVLEIGQFLLKLISENGNLSVVARALFNKVAGRSLDICSRKNLTSIKERPLLDGSVPFDFFFLKKKQPKLQQNKTSAKITWKKRL